MPMARSSVVTPLLIVAMFGCSSSDGIEPTVSTNEELSRTATPGPTCRALTERAPLLTYSVGTPVTVTLRTENVTTSCRCQDTDSPYLSCGGDRFCRKDNPPNPQLCSRLGSVPGVLPALEAKVYREPMRSLVSPAECTAVVTRKDASESAVTVRCTTAGAFGVELLSNDALFTSPQFLLFTTDGACPTSGGVDEASDAAAD